MYIDIYIYVDIFMNLYIFREQMTIKSTYIFIFFVFLGEFILAQFGQNIAQYKKFDWKYIQTKYFDIYFYEDGQKNTYLLYFFLLFS